MRRVSSFISFVRPKNEKNNKKTAHAEWHGKDRIWQNNSTTKTLSCIHTELRVNN